jgi:hypothetical protein
MVAALPGRARRIARAPRHATPGILPRGRYDKRGAMEGHAGAASGTVTART